jgi:8-oxo-dGTP pyrophosphatase MutT (NUDIX family)
VEGASNRLIEAAVLVPVFRREDGALRIVLIRRSARGVHGGQLAFPGGKCETADRSPLDTALREAREEIGIASDRVAVLAHLPPVETLVTGFQIFPFLARIEPRDAWQCQDDEVAEVIEVLARDLARPEAHAEDMTDFPDWTGPRPLPFYRIGPHRLWGATYRILHQLLPRLLADEWEI